MLKREQFWCLTIEFWHGDSEAGEKPRPHSFFFRHPPTRDNFQNICKQLPWTSVWNDTLFSILAKHPWPMIDYMHKSAGVELFEQEKLVGRVNVYREDRWENHYVSVPSIFEEINEVTGRCKDKDGARRYVEGRRYEIMEKVAAEPVEIADDIRRVLVEGGFIKSKKRKAVTPTTITNNADITATLAGGEIK